MQKFNLSVFVGSCMDGFFIELFSDNHFGAPLPGAGTFTPPRLLQLMLNHAISMGYTLHKL